MVGRAASSDVHRLHRNFACEYRFTKMLKTYIFAGCLCSWVVPGYTLHENEPKRQMANGTLVRSHLSNPKPGHTTGASGRSARRGGGVGSGRTGCQQNCSPRKQASLVPPKASKTRFLVSPEARTSEILCKPMEEQNPWLNRGLTAGREALFVPGC